MFRRNYPNPSVPTENEDKPSTRVSLDDYFRILTEQMGQQATIIAEIERRTRLAKTRQQVMRFAASDVGSALSGLLTKQPPVGDWSVIRVPRPSSSEIATAFAHDIYLIVDDIPYYVPQQGLTVIPIDNPRQIGLLSAGSPPTGWSMDIILSNRTFFAE